MNRKFFAFNPYSIHTRVWHRAGHINLLIAKRTLVYMNALHCHQCASKWRCRSMHDIHTHLLHNTHWIWAMAFNNLDVFDDTTTETGQRRTLSSNTHTCIKSKNIASRFIYRFPVRVLLLFDLHATQSKTKLPEHHFGWCFTSAINPGRWTYVNTVNAKRSEYVNDLQLTQVRKDADNIGIYGLLIAPATFSFFFARKIARNAQRHRFIQDGGCVCGRMNGCQRITTFANFFRRNCCRKIDEEKHANAVVVRTCDDALLTDKIMC